MSADIPVAIIAFNRPQLVARLIDRLAIAKPASVFLICDGARAERREEREKVAAVRSLLEKLPWKCEIHRDYAVENLGCRQRIITGLNTVFEQVNQAIILEDDCLPEYDCFRFAEELLGRYAEDGRVGSVCGTTFTERKTSSKSYRFSRYPLIWGWATWRRAWESCRGTLAAMDDRLVEEVLRDIFPRYRERAYWRYVLNRCRNSGLDTWDYLWAFACWRNRLLHAIPRVSLVENVGCGPDSTHTRRPDPWISPVGRMEFPLTHPDSVMIDNALDGEIEDLVYSKSIQNRFRWLMRSLCRR